MNNTPLSMKQAFALALGFAVACGGQIATTDPNGSPDDRAVSDGGAVDAARPDAGAGLDASGPLPVDAATPSFAITLAPSTIESRPDAVHDVAVTLTRDADFTGDVVLAFDTTGDVAIDPPSATIPAGATTTTIRAHLLAHAAPLNTSTVRVRASSGSVEKTATLAFTVTVPHGSPDRSVPEILFSYPFTEGYGAHDYRRRASDGVIWACGRTESRASVFRLHADGSYDTAFGAQVLPPPPTAATFTPYDCAVDGSGLLVSGHGRGVGATVLRIGDDGAIDTSFGVGGFVRLAPATTARSVRVDGMGRLLVLGTGGGTYSMMSWMSRLLPDGSLDPTFGSGGTVQVAAAGTVMHPAFAVQPDGGTVVTGHHFGPGYSVVHVVRVSSTGVVDLALGPDGVAAIRPPGDSWLAMRAELDGAGRLLVLGIDDLVARILPSGAPDPAFGTAGFVDVTPQLSSVQDLALQPDGSILVGGTVRTGAYGLYGALRLGASGTPDLTFGAAGLASGCPGTAVTCAATALLPIDANRFMMIGHTQDYTEVGVLHFWH